MIETPTVVRLPRVEATRPVEPLVPPPRVTLDAVGGAHALATSARLVLLTKWPFFAFLVGVGLATALTPPALAPRLGLLAGIVLGMFGFLRGIDGRSRQLAFWAGLGGPPAAWEAGTVCVDIAAMGLVAALAQVGVGATSNAVPIGLAGALVLYGAGSLSRSAASHELGRAGIVLALLASGFGGLVAAILLSLDHIGTTTLLGLGLVAVGGVAVRLLGAARAPESAAGRGPWRLAWLLFVLLPLLHLPAQLLP